MSILNRIEEIRAVEHQKLRTALMRVEDALQALEDALAEELRASQVQSVDIFGEPIYNPRAHQEQPRQLDLTPVKKSWQPLEETILERLNQWEERLWPMVRRWVHGEDVAVEIQQIAADLLSARNLIDRYLADLRRHAWFVEELTQPLHVLFAAVELCDRAEQDEVIPALLSGSRETADRVERTLSSDDIARNLRASLRTPERPPERKNDPLGRLLSWMGGRGAR